VFVDCTCSLYAGVVVVVALGVNATLALLEEAEAAPGVDGADAAAGTGAGASGVDSADEKAATKTNPAQPVESITQPLLSDSKEQTL
jgi:hypothetical protein